MDTISLKRTHLLHMSLKSLKPIKQIKYKRDFLNTVIYNGAFFYIIPKQAIFCSLKEKYSPYTYYKNVLPNSTFVV